MARVWQIAAGDERRSYVDLFTRHDLMFLGPGRYDAYEEARYAATVTEGRETHEKVRMVRSFVEEPQPGDFVLLRKGRRLEAVGKVPENGGYEWNSALDDVYGWDLQHTRRVIWSDLPLDLLDTVDEPDKCFFGDIKQMRTFSRIRKAESLARIKPYFEQLKDRELLPLPKPPPEPLSLGELGDALFEQGLAFDACERVISVIERQRRLTKWYRFSRGSGDRPSEAEIIAHAVLPLLLALGWSEQTIAVEWKDIDLAGFDGTPSVPENCVLVCEAKKLGAGLPAVFRQAHASIQRLRLNRCQFILLTDGATFYLYERGYIDERGDVEWRESPGYLNIDKIRTSHVTLPNTSAVDTIVNLTPAEIRRRL